MITCPVWAGRRYAVLGLARSGAATVDALLASGAQVVAWDSDENRMDQFPGVGRGPATPARLDPGLRRGTLKFADPLTLDLSTFDAIVVSPGIPLNRHPIAAAARAANVPFIGDIELFAQARASLPPHKVVGITGTNGKSTTTALVHHVLREAGVPTTMGGNIGLPILAQEPLPEGGVYVLELSSYQIDLTHSLDCDVAVLLNITPDHLDRYKGFEAYAASKARLFEMQSRGVAIIGEDDEPSQSVLQWIRTHRHPHEAGKDAALDAKLDLIPISALHGVLNQDERPSLQGPHNAQNTAAAAAVACAFHIAFEEIDQGFASFPGLPHRMERVATRDNVVFINDSKATNPASTAPALAAFDVVHWILGGRAKSDDLDACRPHFPHVRAAYTIGEAGPRFAAILAPHMPVSDCGDLHAAVRAAAAAARPGEVVLLSPAAASFDQFPDFEARGESFRAAVEALA